MKDQVLEIYKKAIDQNEDFELKGKNMLYTSANGYMFSMINKDGELGFRFHKNDCKEFIAKYEADIFKSHGATMRDYVKIPVELYSDSKLLSELLKKSYDHVMSLPKK